MIQYTNIQHEFEPFFTNDSKILILGSFPSVKSREAQFYYSHPRNRFWVLLSSLLNDAAPKSISEKKLFLAKHNIALWDVIWQCNIKGSSDSSICNVIPTDLSSIIKKTCVSQIFLNGNKAYDLYQKYTYKTLKLEGIKLPSTSPANASYTLSDLSEHWKIILDYLV